MRNLRNWALKGLTIGLQRSQGYGGRVKLTGSMQQANEHYSNETEKDICLNKASIPSDIVNLLNSDETRKEDWFNIISSDLCKIELNGTNGLKSKTGLMEFVYD
jgi:hypothetical protein